MKNETCSTPLPSALTGIFIPLYISLFIVCTHLVVNAQSDIKTQYLWQLSATTPAANALLPYSYIGVNIQNDFGLKELMHKGLNMAWTDQHNSVYAHIAHYGFAKFGELTLQTGYARAFGPKVAIGMSAIYLLQHAESYAATHSFTIDLSALFFLSKKIGLSIYLYNPIRLKYGFTRQDVIPMHFRIEAFYHLSKSLIISAMAEKILPGNFEIGLSLHYQPVRILFLEGTCTQQKAGLGILCQWQNFSAGIKILADYQLGIISQCKLNYFFSHEKKQPITHYALQPNFIVGTDRYHLVRCP